MMLRFKRFRDARCRLAIKENGKLHSIVENSYITIIKIPVSASLSKYLKRNLLKFLKFYTLVTCFSQYPIYIHKKEKKER